MLGSFPVSVSKLTAAFGSAFSTLLVAATALADEAPPTVTRDLSRYKEASLDGEVLLLAAYLVLWVLVAGFAFRLAGKQAKTEAQLHALSQQLDAEAERRP